MKSKIPLLMNTKKKSFSTHNLFSSIMRGGQDKQLKLNNDYFTGQYNPINKQTEHSARNHSSKKSMSQKYTQNSQIKSKENMKPKPISSDGSLSDVKKRNFYHQVKGFTSKLLQGRQYQAQLKQAYRVMHFYQGKIIQLQKITKKYQQILSEQHSQRWKQIQHFLDELKRNCINLKGENQEITMLLRCTEKKFKLAEHKSQSMAKKLGLLIRKKSVQQRQYQEKLRMQNQQQKFLHQQYIISFSEKIQKLEQQFEFLRAENQRMEAMNEQYRLQNERLEDQIKEIRIRSNSSNISIEKYLKQIRKKRISDSSKNQQQKQFSTKTSYSFSKEEQIECDKIIKKLRYNLMRTNLPYIQLIRKMQKRQISLSEQLCHLPYRLTQSEAQDLVHYFSQFSTQKLEKVLMKKIPVYRNFHRKKNTIAVQVSNCFKNIQDQVTNTINLGMGQMTNSSMVSYFKKWQLSQQHVDYINLVHYQQGGELQSFDLNLVANIFLKK